MSLPLTFTTPRSEYDALMRNLGVHWSFLPLRLKLAISSSTLPYDTVLFGLSEADVMSIVNDMPRSAEAERLVLEMETKLRTLLRGRQMASVVPPDTGFGSFVS
jgi:hypothetical protein